MTHLTEEQIVLHYYGDADHAAHLAGCAPCRQALADLASLLDACRDVPVPEPAPYFEQRLWSALAPRLPRKARWYVRPWILGPVFAGLLTAAFFAGRVTQKPAFPAPVALLSATGQQRLLLVALGDHLERSQMVLVELANAAAPGSDISSEQLRARALVSENRLYRQTAALSGDAEYSGLLEELERVLLDISNSPSTISSPALEQIQRRIESHGLLFKIRVVGSNLQQKGAEKL